MVTNGIRLNVRKSTISNTGDKFSLCSLLGLMIYIIYKAMHDLLNNISKGTTRPSTLISKQAGIYDKSNEHNKLFEKGCCEDTVQSIN